MSIDTGHAPSTSANRTADGAVAAPAAGAAADTPGWACARSPLGTFPECPMCGGRMAPEHAHERCSSCGWRDSCCD